MIKKESKKVPLITAKEFAMYAGAGMLIGSGFSDLIVFMVSPWKPGTSFKKKLIGATIQAGFCIFEIACGFIISKADKDTFNTRCEEAEEICTKKNIEILGSKPKAKSAGDED